VARSEGATNRDVAATASHYAPYLSRDRLVAEVEACDSLRSNALVGRCRNGLTEVASEFRDDLLLGSREVPGLGTRGHNDATTDRQKDLELVVVNTTVQPKALALSTDARIMRRGPPRRFWHLRSRRASRYTLQLILLQALAYQSSVGLSDARERSHVSDKASPRRDSARRVDRMIGRRLRRARVLNGTELRDFAKALGVSVTMAEQFETGQRRIDPVLLVRAVTYLQVSLAYVFSNDREPKIRRFRRRNSR
jgi:hypothetical protein